MGSYDKKIAEGAKQFLEPGESVKAAFITQPRGTTQAIAGVHALGASQAGGHSAAAAQAGFAITKPMALAVTERRLLSLKISSALGMGIGGEVKELAGAVPLAQVDNIELKKAGMAKIITVSVNGTEFKLEANVKADVDSLISAYNAAKGGG